MRLLQSRDALCRRTIDRPCMDRPWANWVPTERLFLLSQLFPTIAMGASPQAGRAPNSRRCPRRVSPSGLLGDPERSAPAWKSTPEFEMHRRPGYVPFTRGRQRREAIGKPCERRILTLDFHGARVGACHVFPCNGSWFALCVDQGEDSPCFQWPTVRPAGSSKPQERGHRPCQRGWRNSNPFQQGSRPFQAMQLQHPRGTLKRAVDLGCIAAFEEAIPTNR